MDKTGIIKQLDKLQEAQFAVSNLREQSRAALNEFMKERKQVVFPEHLIESDVVDGLVDALESHSEGVLFEKNDGMPAYGMIQKVVWNEEEESSRVVGILIESGHDNILPEFSCPISGITDVDAVLKFVNKFSE